MRGGLVSVCSRFYSRVADEMEMSQAEPGRARGLTVVHRMKILDIKRDREEKRREKNEKKRDGMDKFAQLFALPTDSPSAQVSL